MGGLETLLPALSAGGVFGVLLGVIIYLLRTNASDRKDYRAAVETWETQFEDSVTRYRELQAILDGERLLRRQAQEEAARATMATERASYEIAGLREKADRANNEIAGLRGEVAALRLKISEMNGL